MRNGHHTGFTADTQILIYVNREKRGRSAAHGGRAEARAPGFALGIVVTGARELCEAVETVGAGCRDFVMCRGQRGEVCVPGVRFAGARLAEGNNPGVWIEGRVLLAGALVCVCGVGFAPSSIVGARGGTGPRGVNFGL